MWSVYPCNLCNRDFNSPHALSQHLKFSSRHEYCRRCNRSFGSWSAWEQHLKKSNNHHRCYECDYDAHTREDLLEHQEEEHSVYECIECGGAAFSEWDLEEHQRTNHNKCLYCRRFFDTPDNLRAHLITHRPRDIECLACYDCFACKSAMVLHLEGSFCDYAQNLDEERITYLALKCYASKRYRSQNPCYPFRCPDCYAEFRVISALFQHAESEACNANLDPGSPLDKFLTFLEKNL